MIEKNDVRKICQRKNFNANHKIPNILKKFLEVLSCLEIFEDIWANPET